MSSQSFTIKSASFKTSIADIEAYASVAGTYDCPEICVAGRSNVGKSSFINLLTGQNKLAKTSSVPGRTRLLNLFGLTVEGKGLTDGEWWTVNGKEEEKISSLLPPHSSPTAPPSSLLTPNSSFILVDLPGYGYAQAAKKEIERWGGLIEDYFAASQKLVHVFSLVDIRHEPSALDKQMIKFLYQSGIPFTVVATKSDKIKKSALQNNLQMLAAGLAIGRDNIIACSAETREGRDKVLARLGQVLGENQNLYS